MRRYETVFIANSELADENRQSLLEKLQDLLSGDQAVLVKLDEWGNKRLAYEVKKQTRGYYVLMDYCGNGDMVKELERNMRLDDRVLKYMTVLKDETADMEAIKAEMEAAKAASSQRESAQEKAEEGAAEVTDDSPGEMTGEGEEAPPTETAAEPAQETADKPAQETVDKPAQETADKPAQETADKPGAETVEAPSSEPETTTDTPESNDQEEQQDETT
jgi:small subunit ribosomal protein S6